MIGFRWEHVNDPRPRPSHYRSLGNCRCALVPIARGFWPTDVKVPPPSMRGLITEVVWPPAPEPEPLPDGVWERDGLLFYECRGCERAVQLECELDEYHPNVAYCGGSPRCLP